MALPDATGVTKTSPIYPDPSLGTWYDVPEADVVHSMAVPDSKLGGSYVWVRAAADIKHRLTRDNIRLFNQRTRQRRVHFFDQRLVLVPILRRCFPRRQHLSCVFTGHLVLILVWALI